MATLMELLGSGEKRAALIADSLRVLDEEVDDKSGLGGMAVKTAYKVVKGTSPDFLHKVMNGLLDDFLVALDPMYQEAVAAGQPAGSYLAQHSSRVADTLLSITDARAERSSNPVVSKTYGKLRSSAKKHVEAAVPRLSQLVDRHVPA